MACSEFSQRGRIMGNKCGAERLSPWSLLRAHGAAASASRFTLPPTRPKSRWCLSRHRSAPWGRYQAPSRDRQPTGLGTEAVFPKFGIGQDQFWVARPNSRESVTPVSRGRMRIMGDDQNDRAQQIHGPGCPSHSSGSLPASNVSMISPNNIVLMVQISTIYLDNEPLIQWFHMQTPG
jgi:hypothetical protein